jgi:hypothetical protein
MFLVAASTLLPSRSMKRQDPTCAVPLFCWSATVSGCAVEHWWLSLRRNCSWFWQAESLILPEWLKLPSQPGEVP